MDEPSGRMLLRLVGRFVHTLRTAQLGVEVEIVDPGMSKVKRQTRLNQCEFCFNMRRTVSKTSLRQFAACRSCVMSKQNCLFVSTQRFGRIW